MSETPRTDAVHAKNVKSKDPARTGLEDYVAMMEHAQALERENASLIAELSEYERTVAHMRDGARLQDSATAAVMERAEKAEAEMKEQCRLLAMGSEREARLMARVAELDKANTGLAEEVRILRHRLDDLVEAFDGSADMDEMDGPEYAEASAKLESAIEAARPHTEKALLDAAMRGTE